MLGQVKQLFEPSPLQVRHEVWHFEQTFPSLKYPAMQAPQAVALEQSLHPAGHSTNLLLSVNVEVTPSAKALQAPLLLVYPS